MRPPFDSGEESARPRTYHCRGPPAIDGAPALTSWRASGYIGRAGRAAVASGAAPLPRTDERGGRTTRRSERSVRMPASPLRSMYDSAAEMLDRRIGWARMPLPVAILTLIGLRNRLREEN